MDPTTYAPTRGFGALRAHWPSSDDQRIVVMELDTPATVRDAWLGVPAHPNVLDAVTCTRKPCLLVRYAAIRWNHVILHADSEGADATLARWGKQLVAAYMMLRAHVPEQLVWFTNPLVLFDLEDHVRLAFLAVSPARPETTRHLAPELVRRWPRCDEPALVFLVGSVLRTLWLRHKSLRTPLDPVLARCTEPKPALRYPTLRDLDAALGTQPAVRTTREFQAWNLLEAGLGELALQRPDLAAALLVAARAHGATPAIVDAGERVASEQEPHRVGWTAAGRYPDPLPPPTPRAPLLAWEQACSLGRAHERVRGFADALAIYTRVGERPVELDLALARCHLELGDHGHATDHATRAIAADPTCIEAHQLRTRALHAAQHFVDALSAADVLLARAPSGTAHYLRGRSLLSLARLAEAREAFDRAGALEPSLVEAMLLRREADRAMQRVRDRTGVQPARIAPLPDHLAHLEPLLANARFTQAIEVLEQLADPVAQLVLAACLVASDRAAEAIAVYDRIPVTHEDDAVVGKAFALLELGRADEVLALLAFRSDDADTIEARGRALAALGRTVEGDREIDRLVIAPGERSSRFRFRAAVRWDHGSRG
ncbi:MAG: hypothetical protein ABI867_14805 [Kofleriaceae bacterium]